jgi:hypothetical protein
LRQFRFFIGIILRMDAKKGEIIMKKSLLVVCGLITMMICAGTLPAGATTLWYNGNWDLNNGLPNGINTQSGNQHTVYDDFIVPSGGWTIDSVWSNNYMLGVTVTEAHWEIRSGVSAGNGGILVDSGTGAASVTTTGRSAGIYTENTVQVAGLNVILGPGTYWLNVSPIGSGSGAAYLSATTGAYAIGLPPGNDGDSFINGTPYNFDHTSVIFGSDKDFSMGIAGTLGTPIPLPPSLLLLGSGLLGLAITRRRKLRRK